MWSAQISATDLAKKVFKEIVSIFPNEHLLIQVQTFQNPQPQPTTSKFVLLLGGSLSSKTNKYVCYILSFLNEERSSSDKNIGQILTQYYIPNLHRVTNLWVMNKLNFPSWWGYSDHYLQIF